MILKASQRGGGSALASHLLNDRDNDHVSVLEVRGFMSDDLRAAFDETRAIASGTRCKQYLFSMSLNPPKKHDGTEQDFLDAVERAETKLGLSGQPRAIVMHEKEGRRHAHVVWSRIDADEMKAINMPFFKSKLRDLARDLYLDHGWVLPDGLQGNGGKNPLNFTLAEWQQAKRHGLDPREIKSVFQEAWTKSDNLKALGTALEERGYYLAKGDRRSFVAVDTNGEVYSLSRTCGIKTRDVKARLGSLDDLASVDAVKAELRLRMTTQLKDFIRETKAKHARDMQPLVDSKDKLKAAHRSERQRLKAGQEKRWNAESKTRMDRLNSGLRGFFQKITGKASSIAKGNEREAYQALMRDRGQRDDMVAAQLKERQGLQKQFTNIRSEQKQDRKILARQVMQALRNAKATEQKQQNNQNINHDQEQRRQRTRGFTFDR